MNNNSNKPIAEVRCGTVKAAIWKNAVDNGNDSRAIYNVTFQQLYRDEQNRWQSADSFGRDDLRVLAMATRHAFERIHELQQSERQTDENR